jgi:DNA-binding response OmpR family regulator
VANSKILVIDDSRVIRKTVRDMLPDGDFEVIEAKDGVEGINLINQEHPSLIMLDFILPKMSGWEVFQQIQAHSELQKIPLVLMSGKKEEVTSKISEPFEYFEFIEKPFDRAILSEAIKIAMTKARKARPRAAEVTSSFMLGGDPQISGEVVTEMQTQISQLQEQFAQLQKAAGSEIKDLQAQLSAVVAAREAEPSRSDDRISQSEIQDLKDKLAALQQSKDTEHRAVIAKVMELENEIDTLKKQLGQLVVLIKKKLVS